MRISFLIPTKNRLDLLRFAISSILDQALPDFEIVISDNCSDDDYQSYIDQLSDPRIIYFRHTQAVSVTDNWRMALSLCSGDYFLMLGDDDALAPKFSEFILPVLARDHPDVVYLAAYHYAYPGVIPGQSAGYLATVRNSEFLIGNSDAFCLLPGYARELAESIFDFRYRIGFNAQYYLIRTPFAKSFDERGGLYQSPYPDTFAAITICSHARSFLVIPKETVIIGISPKSFGAYYFSHREKEGYEFLDNERVDSDVRQSLEARIVPGDANNTNWLIAAESARRMLPANHVTAVNIERYRALQIAALLRYRYLDNRPVTDLFAQLSTRLPAGERILFEMLNVSMEIASKLAGNLPLQFIEAINRCLAQFTQAEVRSLDIGQHRTILDAIAWLKQHPGT